jgi:5'-nucleotidase/UDP-sugar diphosphatase
MTALFFLLGCLTTVQQDSPPAIDGMDVRLTILHTSDIHSRLTPYEFEPSFTDQSLGLSADAGPYGGIARIGHILKRERKKSGRVLHLDSGDSFQGAIVFNEFDGEAEVRMLSEIGLNAAVVANHEFDKGARNLSVQYGGWGTYDLLAANYDFEAWDLPWATELEKMILPSKIYDLEGLRVGVIGLGNFSSLNSIYDESNSMGVTPIEPGAILPSEAAKLRSQGADIIIVVSHMGLDDDQEQALQFADIDIFMGGHHHVAIDPPLVITNEETGKRIPVVHSGAFSKFIGRLDVVVRDGQVLSHDYTLFPVDRFVPQDASILDIMEEYSEELKMKYNTDQVIAYAEEKLTRYGSTGGDSMLGNFAAEAMRFYPGVETEIALTNTLGIRSDIPPGDITIDVLFNSMPFDNTITTMFLSGREVQELLDYVSSRSTERGCSSQAQIAGIQFDMVCDPFLARAENILVNGIELDLEGTYELATNNYIANGGSGFEVLERNTTQTDTGISIRDVVKTAFIKAGTLPNYEEGICIEDGRINTIY